MKIANELAKIVVGIIESAGYLKPAARADGKLMSDLEAAIAGRIKENREQLLNFILWWGERGHKQHPREATLFDAKDDWRKCHNALCLSLYQSAIEIESELEPFRVTGANS